MVVSHCYATPSHPPPLHHVPTPCSEEYPKSYWQCCHVLWEDGATDLLSPWDMEPIPQRNNSHPYSNSAEHDPDTKLDDSIDLPSEERDSDSDRDPDFEPSPAHTLDEGTIQYDRSHISWTLGSIAK